MHAIATGFYWLGFLSMFSNLRVVVRQRTSWLSMVAKKLRRKYILSVLQTLDLHKLPLSQLNAFSVIPAGRAVDPECIGQEQKVP